VSVPQLKLIQPQPHHFGAAQSTTNQQCHIHTASTAATVKSNARSGTQPTTFRSLNESAKKLDTTIPGERTRVGRRRTPADVSQRGTWVQIGSIQAQPNEFRSRDCQAISLAIRKSYRQYGAFGMAKPAQGFRPLLNSLKITRNTSEWPGRRDQNQGVKLFSQVSFAPINHLF
jgi:hypothetical protein